MGCAEWSFVLNVCFWFECNWVSPQVLHSVYSTQFHFNFTSFDVDTERCTLSSRAQPAISLLGE